MKIVEVTMTEDRDVPGYGRLRAGSTYSLDERTAADLDAGDLDDDEAAEEETVRTADTSAAIETQTAEPAPENAATRTGKPPAGKWTLSLTPAEYLARYPDGPNAALARALVGEP